MEQHNLPDIRLRQRQLTHLSLACSPPLPPAGEGFSLWDMVLDIVGHVMGPCGRMPKKHRVRSESFRLSVDAHGIAARVAIDHGISAARAASLLVEAGYASLFSTGRFKDRFLTSVHQVFAGHLALKEKENPCRSQSQSKSQ